MIEFAQFNDPTPTLCLAVDIPSRNMQFCGEINFVDILLKKYQKCVKIPNNKNMRFLN